MQVYSIMLKQIFFVSAASCDHAEIVELLLANGADVTMKDSDEETPIDCADQRTKAVFDRFLSKST